LSDMPQDLQAHLRYPEGLFRAQAERYAIYHMTKPRLFYTKEDRWAVAPSPADGSRGERIEQGIEPYYVLMRLRGQEQLELVLMVPFTPITSPNMIAWMAARCDRPHYGELVAYTFPKDKLVYAPAQVRGRINQDQQFSQLKTLLGQVGSRVVHGDLLVMPLGESILYVEGMFLAAAQGQIPEIKQVIVVGVGGQVHVSSTLDMALAKAVGAAPSAPVETAPPTARAPARGDLSAAVESAIEHFQRSQERMKAGDWEGYGKEQEQLKAALEQLRRGLAASPR